MEINPSGALADAARGDGADFRHKKPALFPRLVFYVFAPSVRYKIPVYNDRYIISKFFFYR